MPRPHPAQLVYGSATVSCATLAMLLLFETRSGAWIAVIALVSLALGLLVALAVPTAGPTLRRRRTVARVPAAVGSRAPAARPEPAPATRTAAAPAPAPAPAATAGLGARN
ncbi:hypothetical protein [Streptomyces sp. AA1529]|uniref:hypothetical protein n=1 Tax=Streptomyces sp. AA1529 TaxID=1203257 RepID=UPI00030CFB72|nr:hypothetical protein [Streptomyces sp. AA1529]